MERESARISSMVMTPTSGCSRSTSCTAFEIAKPACSVAKTSVPQATYKAGPLSQRHHNVATGSNVQAIAFDIADHPTTSRDFSGEKSFSVCQSDLPGQKRLAITATIITADGP
jgi:hypothetical protein